MRATATLVQYIQEHQNDVYEEIRKLGIEEGRNLAQNDAYNEGYATGYSDTIQDGYTFEQFRLEGKKDG
jgi:flagellar biosynthesis/type III secretory pathway protein FliH